MDKFEYIGFEPNGKKTSFKVSTGSTGVEFRYYTLPEFKKLTIPQKKELSAHRAANGNYVGSWTGKAGGTKTPVANDGGKKNRGKNAYITKAQIASLLTEHDAQKEKKAND